jgi:ABC-2 type transport system ATP-binding protein
VTATPTIQATGLRKVYSGMFRRSGQLALEGLDLSVPPGTAFGLIGPNGAGKTTFIKLLLGVVRPTSGSVRVLGGEPEDTRVRARIGYLPERLHLPGSWTPPAFLDSVCRLKGLRPDKRELSELIGRVGLSDAAGRRIGGFSKGMRQRLGLAAALLGKPDLLILDEPTDGIDPLGRVEVRRLLSEELSRGVTLFLNSHLLSETERICDRIGILSNGKMVREGPLEELRRAKLRWHLRFVPGANAEALTQAGLVPAGEENLWRCEAENPQALNAALDKARAAGALVLEITREVRDLEDVLADAMGVAA